MEYSLTQAQIETLRQLPLMDVMEANGHTPARVNDSYAYYNCPLPSHEDRNASFYVTLQPCMREKSGDASLCAFGCKGCRKIEGWGAIELQASLMGITAKGEDFWRVVTALCRHHNIRFEQVQVDRPAHISKTEPRETLGYTPCEWTDWHYRALGVSAHMLATREEMLAQLGSTFSIQPVEQLVFPVSTSSRDHEHSIVYSATPDSPAFVITMRDSVGNKRIRTYVPNASDPRYKWGNYDTLTAGRKYDTFATSLNGDRDVIEALYNPKVSPSTSSEQHPVEEYAWTDRQGNVQRRTCFRRVAICSGPRDAMQVYLHSDCHVVYPQSESCHIDDRLLKRLRVIASEVYIIYDSDRTGQEYARKMNLDHLWMHNVELPDDLALHVLSWRTGKPCKDVAEFFAQYGSTLYKDPRMRHTTLEEYFETLLAQSHTLQFYTAKATGARKVRAEGVVRMDYSLSPTPMLRFLFYSGLCRYVDENGRGRTAFVEEHKVRFFHDDQELEDFCRDIMDRWYYEHASKVDIEEPQLLLDTIASSRVLSTVGVTRLPEVQLDFSTATPECQYIPFNNGVLKVEADKRTLMSYADIPFYVNVDSILPDDWVESEDEVWIQSDADAMQSEEIRHRERLMMIEPGDKGAQERERYRWAETRKLCGQRLRLRRPMNEQCIWFQFLYDTSRIHHREEDAARRKGLPEREWLSATHKMQQDAICCAKMMALGYLLHRYHSGECPLIVDCIDAVNRNEQEQAGGTGKSLFFHLLNLIGNVFEFSADGIKDDFEIARVFAEYDYMRHTVFCFNDLNPSVKFNNFKTIAEGKILKKNLHRDAVMVPESMAAKVIITMNHTFASKGKTEERRLWELPFSTYYHETADGEDWGAYQKFGCDLIDGIDEEERHRAQHLLVYCLQYWLRNFGRPLRAPELESTSIRHLYASDAVRDKKFIDWANKFFAHEWYFGHPIPVRDMLISWYQYRHPGSAITRQSISGIHKTEFENALMAYCRALYISVNPDVVLRGSADRQNGHARVTTWCYEFDENGGLLARRQRKAMQCNYFFHMGQEPRSVDEVVAVEQSDIAPDGYINEE